MCGVYRYSVVGVAASRPISLIIIVLSPLSLSLSPLLSLSESRSSPVSAPVLSLLSALVSLSRAPPPQTFEFSKGRPYLSYIEYIRLETHTIIPDETHIIIKKIKALNFTELSAEWTNELISRDDIAR